jgi:hypothetical protein
MNTIDRVARNAGMSEGNLRELTVDEHEAVTGAAVHPNLDLAWCTGPRVHARVVTNNNDPDRM